MMTLAVLLMAQVALPSFIPTPVHATPTSIGKHASCLFIWYGGTMRGCFLPSQVREAEMRMDVSPVSPVGAVHRITRLSLTQIILRGLSGRGVDVIEYIFGTIPKAFFPSSDATA